MIEFIIMCLQYVWMSVVLLTYIVIGLWPLWLIIAILVLADEVRKSRCSKTKEGGQDEILS